MKRIALRKDGTISVSDFRRIVNEMEKENENLRELNRKQSKAFKSAMKDYRELLRDYIKIGEENKKLNEKLEEVEKDLAHRNSFFSIMYDVLGNENVSSYLLYDIVNAVVKSECGAEEELDEEDLDCLKKFWEGFYKRF